MLSFIVSKILPAISCLVIRVEDVDLDVVASSGRLGVPVFSIRTEKDEYSVEWFVVESYLPVTNLNISFSVSNWSTLSYVYWIKRTIDPF